MAFAACVQQLLNQIEDKSLDVIQSAEGMKRDFSGILALFPPMDVSLGETARGMPWNDSKQINAGPKRISGAFGRSCTFYVWLLRCSPIKKQKDKSMWYVV